MKRRLTEEEKRELEIVMLAYELQDADSEDECDPHGPLDEKYYHQAAVELGYEKEGERPPRRSNTMMGGCDGSDEG